MSLKILFHVNVPTCVRIQNILNRKCFASSATPKDSTINVEKSVYEVADETPIYDHEKEAEQQEILKKRNKSRLEPQHRNMLHGQRPYDQPIEWFHHTVKYKKRMLGRHGMKALDVPAGFAWPTPEEVEDMKEYERVAYPYSIREEWARIEEKNKKEAEEIRAREADISAKMIKMEKWIAELNDRLARKEAEVLEAKKRRERLIEEVRNELGAAVSVYDDKFKEMLVRKEKETKKREKEEKMKLREQKLAKAKNTKSANQNVITTESNEPAKEPTN